MHVTKKDLDTITELSAFVSGALESADDVEYWGSLEKRTNNIEKKMHKQFESQQRRNNKRQLSHLTHRPATCGSLG